MRKESSIFALTNQINYIMKKLLPFLALCLVFTPLSGQEFGSHFNNQTLRVDYIFSGDSAKQFISLSELSQSPVWAGKRNHLAEVPLAGNGQIEMKDSKTHQTIYKMSFSSLFQEWLTTQEATKTTKAFENTFQLPMPLNPVDVSIQLTDVYAKIQCKLTHHIDPKDILIRKLQSANPPFKYIWKGGEIEKCIDVAIVAEGYTANEKELFYRDAEIATESLFSHEPFKKLKNRFNIIAVACPSKDSGVSVPLQNIWKETAAESNFSTFYSDRYLTTTHIRKLYDQLAGIPFEHLIILANTDVYGGGGIYNSYTLTTSHHVLFKPVVVHEFGHSFGGLGDEYYYDDQYTPMYPAGVEPWEPNLTTLTHFETKWKDMLPTGTQIPTPPVKDPSKIYTQVGVFEGGGYSSKGVYRPAMECRMKINEAPGFCPVCQRALERIIRFYTDE